MDQSQGSRPPTFTSKIVEAIRQLYPEWAASSWDNTGLLIDSTREDPVESGGVVLLTNDVTDAVVTEALEMKASIIISYHPLIFRGLTRLTDSDPQQRSILRLVSAGVAVYSPHSAVDNVHDGMNDWLLDQVVSLGLAPQVSARLLGPDRCATREWITPVPPPASGAAVGGFAPHAGCDASQRATHFGVGRRLRLPTAPDATIDVAAVLAGLVERFSLPGALLAEPAPRFGAAARDGRGRLVARSVGVCVGSGWDVLKDSGCDLLVTGEISHHAALLAAERGQCVVALLHSNSERGYLGDVMQGKLRAELAGLGVANADVRVSKADKDPLLVVDSAAAQRWNIAE